MGRKISQDAIANLIEKTILQLSCKLSCEVVNTLTNCYEQETNYLAKNALDIIIKNNHIASTQQIPLCQDTGIVVCFVELGRQVELETDLEEAINLGVSRAYQTGYLRKSVVAHPLKRINTLDNTPAIIHLKSVEGDQITFKIMLKGAGSENMSTILMLKPTIPLDQMVQQIVDAVISAGGRPCPPIMVGIGIGGDFELCAKLAKEALFESIDDHSQDQDELAIANLIKDQINQSGIGVMGYGGINTCLGVKIKTYPCHIASLPVAINIQCHSIRHQVVKL